MFSTSRTARAVRALAAAAAILLGVVATHPSQAMGETSSIPTGGFSFEIQVVVPVTPERAFEAFTRETLQWWDHHFSENPRALHFETKPGGGFIELFDDAGNGAWHATVTYVERPKRLRFVGPLGLAGNAIEIAHTLDFESAEGGTRVKLAAHAVGELREGWPGTVEAVWRHFLVEQFVPYVTAHPD